ncbi:MAG: biotin synthase BioB [Omnitrophica WOR_2 bacterium GWA2_63_20]|nr:MAG: biotin synthase BioB [Omnitrophica WOR_2 bacterium GWA2_63_20]OGX33136.1 MAG: biotin synthase BioB [Omnitrophica WOR_2 bacterium RIFCSPHIGHO2_12_FULL_64_13]OGX47483.1 MAG: biotin synthase BioB [Omnitrophica WOR_2 bacterium RIFCSPLOWO2_12_FULL_63_16]HAM39924.1 biotin synthase BioB [Candidatus Omnitrophota bacterium]HBQ38772.1 biotin synthase BioB [Candidatus Omnitrophota bacterium]
MEWSSIISRSLTDEAIAREEALDILRLPDEQIVEVLRAAFEVRQATYGKRVKICLLQNARSGLCPEDCHYCSQSAVSTAPIARYLLLPLDQLMEGARRAREAGARRYCMVTSGRGPSEEDIAHFCEAARLIKSQYPLEICVSLGILSGTQAHQLKEAGVGWVNHNLNTSARHHPAICTTHTYQDRLQTVRNVQQAGLMTCSGGIVGMGETDEDLLELALALRELRVNSLPVNFLNPIPGTPLEACRALTPMRCLKILCLFRFLNPKSDLRAAGGREVNLRSLQPLALYPANSIFVDGYLTTPGQAAQAARQMVSDMGFELEES